MDISHIILRQLVATFAPLGPLVVGIDATTIKRWRGPTIAAAIIYRDPTRSQCEPGLPRQRLAAEYVGHMLDRLILLIGTPQHLLQLINSKREL